MRPYQLPSEFMPSDFLEDIKLRKERKKKEQSRKLKIIFLFLGLLIAGILVCLAYIGTPYLHYFLAIDTAHNTAEPSETPSTSINSYLQPIGMDASTDLKITGDTLHRDGSRSWVAGNVKNTGTHSYKGVSIYFDLFDSEGKSLGATYQLMGNLAPGDLKEFSTNPSAGMASSAKLKYIIGS